MAKWPGFNLLDWIEGEHVDTPNEFWDFETPRTTVLTDTDRKGNVEPRTKDNAKLPNSNGSLLDPNTSHRYPKPLDAVIEEQLPAHDFAFVDLITADYETQRITVLTDTDKKDNGNVQPQDREGQLPDDTVVREPQPGTSTSNERPPNFMQDTTPFNDNQFAAFKQQEGIQQPIASTPQCLERQVSENNVHALIPLPVEELTPSIHHKECPPTIQPSASTDSATALVIVSPMNLQFVLAQGSAEANSQVPRVLSFPWKPAPTQTNLEYAIQQPGASIADQLGSSTSQPQQTKTTKKKRDSERDPPRRSIVQKYGRKGQTTFGKKAKDVLMHLLHRRPRGEVIRILGDTNLKLIQVNEDKTIEVVKQWEIERGPKATRYKTPQVAWNGFTSAIRHSIEKEEGYFATKPERASVPIPKHRVFRFGHLVPMEQLPTDR